MEQPIHCVIIIEILGRPADHVEHALKLVTDAIAKEKNVQLLSKELYKPKQIKTLFSTFAELELKISSFSRLLGLIFDYMPSSIEIIAPQELKLSLNDANVIANDLAARLHKYDAIAKKLGIENTILKRQLLDIAQKYNIKIQLPLEQQAVQTQQPKQQTKSIRKSKESTRKKVKK